MPFNFPSFPAPGVTTIGANIANRHIAANTAAHQQRKSATPPPGGAGEQQQEFQLVRYDKLSVSRKLQLFGSSTSTLVAFRVQCTLAVSSSSTQIERQQRSQQEQQHAKELVETVQSRLQIIAMPILGSGTTGVAGGSSQEMLDHHSFARSDSDVILGGGSSSTTTTNGGGAAAGEHKITFLVFHLPATAADGIKELMRSIVGSSVGVVVGGGGSSSNNTITNTTTISRILSVQRDANYDFMAGDAITHFLRGALLRIAPMRVRPAPPLGQPKKKFCILEGDGAIYQVPAYTGGPSSSFGAGGGGFASRASGAANASSTQQQQQALNNHLLGFRLSAIKEYDGIVNLSLLPVFRKCVPLQLPALPPESDYHRAFFDEGTMIPLYEEHECTTNMIPPLYKKDTTTGAKSKLLAPPPSSVFPAAVRCVVQPSLREAVVLGIGQGVMGHVPQTPLGGKKENPPPHISKESGLLKFSLPGGGGSFSNSPAMEPATPGGGLSMPVTPLVLGGSSQSFSATLGNSGFNTYMQEMEESHPQSFQLLMSSMKNFTNYQSASGNNIWCLLAFTQQQQYSDPDGFMGAGGGDEYGGDGGVGGGGHHKSSLVNFVRPASTLWSSTAAFEGWQRINPAHHESIQEILESLLYDVFPQLTVHSSYNNSSASQEPSSSSTTVHLLHPIPVDQNEAAAQDIGSGPPAASGFFTSGAQLAHAFKFPTPPKIQPTGIPGDSQEDGEEVVFGAQKSFDAVPPQATGGVGFGIAADSPLVPPPPLQGGNNSKVRPLNKSLSAAASQQGSEFEFVHHGWGDAASVSVDAAEIVVAPPFKPEAAVAEAVVQPPPAAATKPTSKGKKEKKGEKEEGEGDQEEQVVAAKVKPTSAVKKKTATSTTTTAGGKKKTAAQSKKEGKSIKKDVAACSGSGGEDNGADVDESLPTKQKVQRPTRGSKRNRNITKENQDARGVEDNEDN